MKRINKFINSAIKLLSLSTLFSLIVSAMGAVVETPYLAYFWYMALLCIALLILISITVAVGLLLRQGIAWLKKQGVLFEKTGSPKGVNSLHQGSPLH